MRVIAAPQADAQDRITQAQRLRDAGNFAAAADLLRAQMAQNPEDGEAARLLAQTLYWPLVPGGGPMARLPRLIGRGRALEVLLGADDIRGDVAELYGYVNRSLPDADLDAFVDALARRIASFDKQAISETKRLVNLASLPADAEIAPEWDAFIASVGRPSAQARIKQLLERGFHQPGDVENRLGYYVGELGK
jgi:hypothetical protein